MSSICRSVGHLVPLTCVNQIRSLSQSRLNHVLKHSSASSHQTPVVQKGLRQDQQQGTKTHHESSNTCDYDATLHCFHLTALTLNQNASKHTKEIHITTYSKYRQNLSWCTLKPTLSLTNKHNNRFTSTDKQIQKLIFTPNIAPTTIPPKEEASAKMACLNFSGAQSGPVVMGLRRHT